LVLIVKRTALALTLMLGLLLSIVAAGAYFKSTEANPLPSPALVNAQMTITIQSPQNGTDNALPVFVNFTGQCNSVFELSTNHTKKGLKGFFYVLDGQNMRSSGTRFEETQITDTYHPIGQTPYNPTTDFSGQAYLTNLTGGIHSITVYYGVLFDAGLPTENVAYESVWSATSQFYVIGEAPPSLPSPTSSPLETESVPITYSMSIVAVIVLVLLGSIVYILKRK
jgi:hypothetical protein